eukprot:TRINITY_DN3826_c0_g1_i1.p1 TRINITY_DN3826_c0_g1~~TRINITY_DN3826_c0_g1_i1.p1  ORF type:complete len:396 (-),score=64.30 TRINITY_DN3826_c0_g1_i1:1523-2710(-)
MFTRSALATTVLVVSVHVAVAVCGPWIPVPPESVPRAAPNDTVEVYYLVAPLEECSHGHSGGKLGLNHGAVAFRNVRTGAGITVNLDATPSFDAAIAPDILYPPANSSVEPFLVPTNGAGVFIYDGINTTYFSTLSVHVASIPGGVFNGFVSRFLPATNATFTRYNLFRVVPPPWWTSVAANVLATPVQDVLAAVRDIEHSALRNWRPLAPHGLWDAAQKGGAPLQVLNDLVSGASASAERHRRLERLRAGAGTPNASSVQLPEDETFVDEMDCFTFAWSVFQALADCGYPATVAGDALPITFAVIYSRLPPTPVARSDRQRTEAAVLWFRRMQLDFGGGLLGWLRAVARVVDTGVVYTMHDADVVEVAAAFPYIGWHYHHRAVPGPSGRGCSFF